MRLSRSSSRTMSSLLSRVRLDVALPYLFFLLAASTIVVAMVVQLRFADQKSDATTTRLAAAAAQDIAGTLEQFDRTLQAMITRQQAPELQNQDVRARNSPLFERIQRKPYFAFIDVLDQKGNSVAGLPLGLIRTISGHFRIAISTSYILVVSLSTTKGTSASRSAVA